MTPTQRRHVSGPYYRGWTRGEIIGAVVLAIAYGGLFSYAIGWIK